MNIKLYSNFKKIVIVIPLAFLINLELLLSNTTSNLSIEQLLIHLSFDLQSLKDKKSLVIAFNSLLTIILFNLFYGNYIYKDISVNGAYLFTRLKDKKKWIQKKLRTIITYSTIYSFFYITSIMIICILHKKQITWSFSILEIYLIMCLAFNIIIILSTIYINFFSIYYGEHMGFFLGYIGFILLFELCLNFEKIPILGEYFYLSFLNPINLMSAYLINGFFIKVIVILYNCSLVYISIIAIKNKWNKIKLYSTIQ